MKRVAAILLAGVLFLAAEHDDPQVLVQRGREAIIHGEPEKAVELFEEAVALKPANADTITGSSVPGLRNSPLERSRLTS